MLVFKIKRFAPPKKGCYHREVNFDAPGADMRMARLKLSGECGVIRCLEQLKWVASGAGGGAGSTPRAKGKMSGLSTPRIHTPCVLIECWKGKWLDASYRHNFPQNRFPQNSQLWHTTRSVERRLPKDPRREGGQCTRTSKKSWRKRKHQKSFPFLIMTMWYHQEFRCFGQVVFVPPCQPLSSHNKAFSIDSSKMR